jgi:hypothetical protein
MTRNPAWWTDKHASAWDRVKDALERDWEQTKADFSSRSGAKLNQGVADTLKQAAGEESIPPLGTKTHPTTPTVAADAPKKTRENMQEVSERADKAIADAREDIAKKRLWLSEAVGAVRKDVGAMVAEGDDELAQAHATEREGIEAAKIRVAESIEKDYAKIEENLREWHDAEQEVRYGYSVRGEYPANHPWDPKLEQKLQAEWDELGTGRTWELARTGIRRGWDYVGRKP